MIEEVVIVLGCIDSYKDENDRAACNMGCDTMAKTLGEVSTYATLSGMLKIFLMNTDIISGII